MYRFMGEVVRVHNAWDKLSLSPWMNGSQIGRGLLFEKAYFLPFYFYILSHKTRHALLVYAENRLYVVIGDPQLGWEVEIGIKTSRCLYSLKSDMSLKKTEKY